MRPTWRATKAPTPAVRDARTTSRSCARYGDRSGGAAGHNGGSPERIALVLKPGSGVAPLFTVYMQGSSIPYDWSRGPVPAAQLAQISRIEITVTAASGKPGQRGGYSRTQITTAVRSMRNAPDFGATVYTVDGYVFEDSDFDRARDSGEHGLSGALVRLERARRLHQRGRLLLVPGSGRQLPASPRAARRIRVLRLPTAS